MHNSRKSRLAFRPTLGDTHLEERLALSGAQASIVAAAQVGANTNLTAAQLRTTYLRQMKNAIQDLRNTINSQVAQLYANGTPTSDQLMGLRQYLKGSINATAFRLASQASLLPGSDRALAANLQTTLLGDNGRSLTSRLDSALQRARNTGSAANLQAALGYNLGQTALGGNYQLNQFFKTTSLNRLSVDQTTGQQIPLQQYLGQQVFNQFSNTLGSFAQSFPNVANSSLFGNGVTTATPESMLSFGKQALGALGVAAYQFGGNAAILPNSDLLAPILQNGLFGSNTGTGPNTSLFGTLQGLPTSATDFGQAATNAFGTGFTNLAGSLSTGLGLSPQLNYSLPSGQIPGVFGQQFSSFGNGFNSGFGSGFIGFGQSPTTGFDPNFGSGFNGVINNVNPNYGFVLPSLGTGTGTTGPGSIGTGTGTTGPGSIGTGSGTGTGTGTGGGAGGTGL